MSKYIQTLPKTIGKNVAKVVLPKGEDEIDRVLLIVGRNGEVFEHAHNIEGEEGTSEVYIFCNDKYFETNDKQKIDTPRVAGLNSPTGELSHSIPSNGQVQFIIAIKKSQEEGKWNELQKDPQKFINDLDFDSGHICGDLGYQEDTIKIGDTVVSVTHFDGNDNFVIRYKNGRDIESATLEKLYENQKEINMGDKNEILH